MLRNYLKVALRVLRRAKLYSSINIIGLALGLAVAILIGVWMQNELSYDRYNANADRIYRVTTYFKMGDFEKALATSAPPIAGTLRKFSEVEAATSLAGISSNAIVSYAGKQISIREVAYADSSFFSVFSLHLLRGNRFNVLTAPNTVVLSNSIARLLLPDSDPIGQRVTLRLNGAELTCEVTGIMQDIPSNSHFHFGALISSSTFYLNNPEYRDK